MPGTDAAYFADGSLDYVNVAFQKIGGVTTTNAAHVTGSIKPLYPFTGVNPIGISALPTLASFSADFDIQPNASPFTVEARSAAGSAIISINPAKNQWQATYVEPTPASAQWNFSAAGFVVKDFISGQPFPNNIIPLSRVDPSAEQAIFSLASPNVAGPPGANGSFTTSGTLQGGHFTVGPGTYPPNGFGGFINLSNRGAQSTTFGLYVDGQLITSQQVQFTTD